MIKRARSRRLAGGFLGMVALVGALEAGIGARRDLADPVALEWRAADRAVRTKTRRVDVLCLGDSMMKYGVAAPVLAARLGRPAANLAMSAAPAAASYFALRHALEAGARPRLVLVDFAPFLLLPGYRLNRQYLPESAGLRDAVDLGWSAADPELLGSLVASRLVPTVRNRDHLRARLGHAWRQPDPQGERAGPRGLWLPGGNREVFDWFYPVAWEPGAEHHRYVERLIALATSVGATVAWLMPPLGADIRGEWDALGLTAQYDRFAESIREQFPDLVIIDARQLPIDAADRSDPLHLTPRGAEAFTAELADLLVGERRLAGWIDMTAPAPRIARGH